MRNVGLEATKKSQRKGTISNLSGDDIVSFFVLNLCLRQGIRRVSHFKLYYVCTYLTLKKEG